MLDLGFGSSNRISSYSTSIDDNQYTSLRLNDNIRAKYSYYLNTDKKQKNIRFYVRSAADFLRDKDYDKNKYSNNQFVITIDFALNERYYFNADNRWFL